MTICLFLLMAGKASAQWSVIDPTNIAQSIINSSNNIVHTSSTAQNMINNFKETVKIYELTGDVPNVTFPCASLHDPETGRIAVYYGCADTVTGLAFGYIPEIVKFTKENNIL